MVEGRATLLVKSGSILARFHQRSCLLVVSYLILAHVNVDEVVLAGRYDCRIHVVGNVAIVPVSMVGGEKVQVVRHCADCS
jgi:hypothetical protein